MKMRRLICTAGAAMLCLTACGTSESGDAPSMDAEMTVTAAEHFDPDYGDCLKRYFEAVERHDFAAYKTTVYPPYLDAYAAYLEENSSSLEQAFDGLCTRFDEDGYESWHLTELQLSYYEGEDDALQVFFDAYTSAEVFGNDFVEDCYKQTNDMQDVVFTVYALYSGDDEAVPVVTNGEILMLKTDEGTFLFG